MHHHGPWIVEHEKPTLELSILHSQVLAPRNAFLSKTFGATDLRFLLSSE